MKTPILPALLVLAACSSQPTEATRYYSLRTPGAVASGEQESAPVYSLGRVELASYIDRPGLVREASDGEFLMARHHRWAEPLRVALRRFLALGIGAEAGQPVALMATSPQAARVDVTIDQLHGDSRGEAVLVAYWEVFSSGGEFSIHQYSGRSELSRDGYTALVEAEQALLQDLARRIGQSL
jgi:uncharacterized lipoprotein YmbA